MSAQIITLTTDFGTCDTYVAQLKGIILGYNLHTRIVDVTHAIPPQNILRAAVCLDDVFDSFPAGTIHIVIVDPGVGGNRRGVLLDVGRQWVIGPDNGLTTLLRRRHTLDGAWNLTVSHFHRSKISAVFHGRDIFAPVAAHLSNGVSAEQLGEPIESPLVELDVPQIERTDRSIQGHILGWDHFGNVITNISVRDLPTVDDGAFAFKIGAYRGQGLVSFYSQLSPGQVGLLVGSHGRIEIAVDRQSAIVKLRQEFAVEVDVGTAIEISF